MKLSKPVIIGLAVALFLALLFGGFLTYSTSRTLEFAEALEFRRMQVAKLDDGHRFFFVTNRSETDTPDTPIEESFGNQRSDLSVGIFDTAIEPALGIGMLINPSDWFQNEEIQIRRLAVQQQSEFLQELKGQVAASPDRSLLININGFRERFPSALRKTAFLAHVLDANMPFLVFDWPGDQGSTMRGYRRAQRIARESGADLANLIRLINDEVQPSNLDIIANSMGGEVVVQAFLDLYEDPEFNDAPAEITHVVLTAPDVDHSEFNQSFKNKMLALTDQVTVYVSANDQALLMSRVLNRSRRLGESTIDPAALDPSRPAPAEVDSTEEASIVYEMMGPEQRLTLIDITPVNRTRNFHNFSLETPEFFNDLFLRLANYPTPAARTRYRVQQSDTPGILGTDEQPIAGGLRTNAQRPWR